MKVEMIDIPMKVWDAVYEKWTEALKTGWDSNLWYPCELCRYIKDIYGCGSCYLCPLNKNSWCQGASQKSRLNIRYHHHDESEWIKDVELFLEYIKPYCSVKYNE